ncbi:MAG: hypothetical protein AAF730_08635 [Bacteroidota bacterium]
MRALPRLSLLVCWCLCGAAPILAQPWIYWVRPGEVGRSSVDGVQEQIILTGSSTPTSVFADPTDGGLWWTDMDTGNVTHTSADGTRHRFVARSRKVPSDVQRAGDYVFWRDHSGIHRAAILGDGVDELVAAPKYESPRALSVGAIQVYWTQSQDAFIHHMWHDGTAQGTLFEVENGTPTGLHVTADYVYWLDANEQIIWRATHAGQQRTPLVAMPNEAITIRRFIVTPDRLYWTENHGRDGSFIRTARLDGSGIASANVPLSDEPSFGLAADGNGGLLWTEATSGRIVQARPGDIAPQARIAAFVQDPTGIAQHDGWVYWSQKALGRSRRGTIERVSLDGRTVETIHEHAYGWQPIDLLTLGGSLVWLDSNWLPGGRAYRLVRYDLTTYMLGIIAEDGFEQPSNLTDDGEWLYWLESAGEVGQIRLDGTQPRQAYRFPAEHKGKKRYYRGLTVGDKLYVGDGSTDGVYAARKRSSMRYLADDLYLSDLAFHAERLYWSGVFGIGTITTGRKPRSAMLYPLSNVAAITVSEE